MKKKTIMHIINSLALGGAESLLVGTISELIDYENIVILLKNENDFGDIKNCSHIYCIDFNSKKDVINSLCVLRKIIRQYNPNIIHAHLIESTLIARMACPSNVKFLFTVHNKMSLNCYQYSRMAWFLDKITYRNNQIMIAVSKEVLNDYQLWIGAKKNSNVLYNFVEDVFFKTPKKYECKLNQLKLVCVATLKDQKNHQFLLKCMNQLKHMPVSLDIYGYGPLHEMLEKYIIDNNLNVRLMGKTTHIDDILPNYDAFVLASTYEGFGIAPLEAMATGLPVLLSNIPIFKEVTNNQALFFELDATNSFVEIINNIFSGSIDMNCLAINGQKEAQRIASKDNYIKSIINIYEG